MTFLEWLFGRNKANYVDRRKRVFISFAIEDEKFRTFLVGQSKSHNSPFEFIDMSVKEAWDEDEWKKRCRTKIKRCHGAIVLLSKNTYHSSGVRYEVKCAIEEGIPIVGMHIKKGDKGAILPELMNKKVINWTWNSIEKFINTL